MLRALFHLTPHGVTTAQNSATVKTYHRQPDTNTTDHPLKSDGSIPMQIAAKAFTTTVLFALLLMIACGKNPPVIPTVDPSTSVSENQAPPAEPTSPPSERTQ